MIIELRKLIAIYLVRLTFWIMPDGELKKSYAKFNYDLMVKEICKNFKK